MYKLDSIFGTATGEASTFDSLISLAPLLIFVAVFYFFLIRPQTKKEKEDKQMRENLEIADEVVTNGGIIGRVVSIKDDTVVIETGSDRCKIRVAKWAIAQNLTVKEKIESDKDNKN